MLIVHCSLDRLWAKSFGALMVIWGTPNTLNVIQYVFVAQTSDFGTAILEVPKVNSHLLLCQNHVSPVDSPNIQAGTQVFWYRWQCMVKFHWAVYWRQNVCQFPLRSAKDWPVDWLTDRLTNCLDDWLTDLTGWRIEWLSDWLTLVTKWLAV